MPKHVNARVLFENLAREVPVALHKDIFVVGSVAAACHYTSDLPHGGVLTKDADVAIRPAGNIASAKAIGQRLLDAKWRRLPRCRPQERAEPRDTLEALRLYPPAHSDYFIELLILPETDQTEARTWHPLQLDDGWYGLPSFRFMALLRCESELEYAGIGYASPCMMALANALSHPELDDAKMSEHIGGRTIRRCAKDLGRVLALATLAGRRETRTWPQRWSSALEQCYPGEASRLKPLVGEGLRALQRHDEVFEEAWYTCNVSLLSGKGVDLEMLRARGEQFLSDVVGALGG